MNDGDNEYYDGGFDDCFECFEDKFPPPYRREDDPVAMAEREELRQRGIDAKNMIMLPVIVNFGKADGYRWLNKCDRKR